jgi:hypothetical protein
VECGLTQLRQFAKLGSGHKAASGKGNQHLRIAMTESVHHSALYSVIGGEVPSRLIILGRGHHD